MRKTKQKQEWPSIVADVFQKLNRYENGSTRFFEGFHRSQQVVSTWRTGKAKRPSETDRIKFLERARVVLKELADEKEKTIQVEAELLSEVLSL